MEGRFTAVVRGIMAVPEVRATAEQVEALTGEPKPVHVGLPGRIVVHVESLVVAVAQVLAMVQCRTLGAGKGNTSRKLRTSMSDAEVILTR